MTFGPNAMAAAIAIALLAIMPVRAEDATSSPISSDPPAGTYRLDTAHARLMFSVSHLGFSEYTAFFRDFSAVLVFDPAAPEEMLLEAKVDPASVETLYPDAALDFNAVIAGESFLDAANFPELSFKSTVITLTGTNKAAVKGDLTLHGVTKPVTLRVRYNGGYAGHPLDPGGARIGFSAEGLLSRSDFGISFGIPAAGTTLGVGDLVTIRIEAEFVNPDVSAVQVGP
ncbi:MAG: YceI family protein [Albidovulum sp.]